MIGKDMHTTLMFGPRLAAAAAGVAQGKGQKREGSYDMLHRQVMPCILKAPTARDTPDSSALEK